jgi:hypothetical protein
MVVGERRRSEVEDWKEHALVQAPWQAKPSTSTAVQFGFGTVRYNIYISSSAETTYGDISKTPHADTPHADNASDAKMPNAVVSLTLEGSRCEVVVCFALHRPIAFMIISSLAKSRLASL